MSSVHTGIRQRPQLHAHSACVLLDAVGTNCPTPGHGKANGIASGSKPMIHSLSSRRSRHAE